MFSAVLLASLLAAEPGANVRKLADEARAARPVGKAKAVARRGGGGFRAFRGAGLAGRTFAVNRFAFHRHHHAGYGFDRFAFGGYGAGATYAGGYGVAAAAPCEAAAYVAPAVAAYAAAPVYAAPVYAAGCGGASAAFGYAPAFGYGYGFRRFGFGHFGHHR